MEDRRIGVQAAHEGEMAFGQPDGREAMRIRETGGLDDRSILVASPLPFIAADQSGPKHINAVLTRAKYEELVGDLVEATVEPCQKALWDAKLKPENIDKVILVGGQTRSQIIGRTVAKVFGTEPSAEINPDEVVAI